MSLPHLVPHISSSNLVTLQLSLSAAIALGLKMIRVPDRTSGKLAKFGPFGIALAAENLPLSYIAAMRRWPWLLSPASNLCGCQARAFPNAMALILHLWDHHVVEQRTMSVEELIQWVAAEENLPRQERGEVVAFPLQ
jgi:hypothetical protein